MPKSSRPDRLNGTNGTGRDSELIVQMLFTTRDMRYQVHKSIKTDGWRLTWTTVALRPSCTAVGPHSGVVFCCVHLRECICAPLPSERLYSTLLFCCSSCFSCFIRSSRYWGVMKPIRWYSLSNHNNRVQHIILYQTVDLRWVTICVLKSSVLFGRRDTVHVHHSVQAVRIGHARRSNRKVPHSKS